MLNNNIKRKKITYIDLFAGAGGISQGFDREGFENIFAIDYDEDSCETYEQNFPKHTILNKKIEDLINKSYEIGVRKQETLVEILSMILEIICLKNLPEWFQF